MPARHKGKHYLYIRKEFEDENIQKMKAVTEIAKRQMESYDNSEKINIIKVFLQMFYTKQNKLIQKS